MASSATIRNSTPPDEGMLMTNDDLVLQTIEPVTHDLGGFKVHRTLPNKARTMVGPFLFFDQMGPAHLSVGQGMDVRPHPHINLATVTYLFAGAIDHRDSLRSEEHTSELQSLMRLSYALFCLSTKTQHI